MAYPQAAVAQAAKSIVALRKLGGSCRRSRVDRTLLYGPTFSVPSGVTAMITEASYSDSLTPALAYVNKRSDRTSRWPERWMIHRPDGSFALYLVNWGVRSTAALTHQNRRAGRSAGGHCSYLPTTREQRKQVSGVVAPMSAPHYFEMKK